MPNNRESNLSLWSVCETSGRAASSSPDRFTAAGMFLWLDLKEVGAIRRVAR